MSVSRTTFRRGFTLIELLVVIAIIGILSSIVLGSLSTPRAKARDTMRMQNLRSLQNALEVYANANDGAYPSTGGSASWRGACSGFGSYANTGATGWIPNLAPSYISTLPVDPNQASSKCYIYASNGVNYMLQAYGTVETFTAANNPLKRPAYPSDPSFAVYTPGASAW